MSTRKHSVKVEILGESYAIRTEAPPEHTKAVAEHLDGAIRRILAGGSVIEVNRAAILAALQITSELFEARDASAAVTSAIQGLSANVRRMLPPRKREGGAGAANADRTRAD
ncbi:MAG TPA: cell division protein ZapA [Gemmatimonadaceae bacterium]|nr:cell division protein ZapA [Gemmatimonadaceae bacterium]